jgi:Uma2 family endonuclease
MTRFVLEGDEVCVPGWVVDLESFRRWTDDDDFPETGQISFLLGEVWVDMSKEQLYTHTDVKSEINTVLRTLVKSTRAGRYLHDGAFVSNVEADISNQPDGVFVSTQSVRDKRVQSVEGRHEGHVELEGSPDMVLEVVSRSSVNKDTEVLRAAYAKAGIREYWLVDARGDAVRFDVLRLGRSGYTPVRKRGGWVRSDVFGRWFRLRQEPGEDGFAAFTLDVQADKPA